MTKKGIVRADVVLKDFWRDNERFADLFNAALFAGERVIEPGSLTERDTDFSSILNFEERTETIQRSADVVKRSTYGVDFSLLSLENQQRIHYAMPLRHMTNDALAYIKQCSQLVRKNRTAGGFRSPERTQSGCIFAVLMQRQYFI